MNKSRHSVSEDENLVSYIGEMWAVSICRCFLSNTLTLTDERHVTVLLWTTVSSQNLSHFDSITDSDTCAVFLHCRWEITSRVGAWRQSAALAANTGGVKHGVLPGGHLAARTGASCLPASARETEGQGQQTD